MRIDTRNFGDIEVNKEKIITFQEGIPGFENLKKFIFIEEIGGQFHYLQSIEDGDVCFVITDPSCFKKDYAPIIKESYFEKLGQGGNDAFSLYTIVTLRKEVEDSTLNLAAPLLIHVENKQGVQVILEDTSYTTRYKLVSLSERS